MKLKDLNSVLWDRLWDLQWAIVWDADKCEELVRDCTTSYAVQHYGEYIVDRITADNNYVVIHVRKEN